jgi:hypothetical protein
MQLTLTTENDLVTYLNFLHQRSVLTSKFPAITLEGKECSDYLQWLYSEGNEEEVDDNETTIVVSAPNVNKSWVQEELDAMASLIFQNSHPSDIGAILKRTESGVRHKARSILNMVYQSGKWRDYNYQ